MSAWKTRMKTKKSQKTRHLDILLMCWNHIQKSFISVVINMKMRMLSGLFEKKAKASIYKTIKFVLIDDLIKVAVN